MGEWCQMKQPRVMGNVRRDDGRRYWGRSPKCRLGRETPALQRWRRANAPEPVEIRKTKEVATEVRTSCGATVQNRVG